MAENEDLNIPDINDDKTESSQSQNTNLIYKLNYLQNENTKLEKINNTLSKEIQIMQENVREMIPGFTSNTSNSFPMLTELQNLIIDYIKITSQDVFFDILQPVFNIQGIVEFFKNIFQYFQSKVEAHFAPAENKIKNILMTKELLIPIENVLRKSYQSNWKAIYAILNTPKLYQNKLIEIINKFELEKNNDNINEMIINFMQKTHELLFLCYICDPQITIDRDQIGKSVAFNGITHDSFDGFIKPKQNCIIILPSFYKGKEKKTKETMIIKSQVLAQDYEFPC